jgi:hypothetical protein
MNDLSTYELYEEYDPYNIEHYFIHLEEMYNYVISFFPKS